MAEIEKRTAHNELAFDADDVNVTTHTDRDKDVLVPPVEQICKGVFINAGNIGRMPVAVPQSSCSRFTLRRKLAFCCCTTIILVAVAGLFSGSILAAHQNTPPPVDSFNSYIYDWTTNSDSSTSDKGDVTRDIDWWSPLSETKKPATSGQSSTKLTKKSTSHGKAIRQTGIPYKNWTQATAECIDSKTTPCDLYKYSCGGWITKTPIPDHFTHVNRFQELGRRASKIVMSYIEKNNRKTPEEKKASLFYHNCINYLRSDRHSVLKSLHNLVKQPSGGALTAPDDMTNLESLLININKLNAWPFFQILPRGSTYNETVVFVTPSDIPIQAGHLAKFSVPDIYLSDEIIEKVKSKISILDKSHGNQPKHISKSSVNSLFKHHTNINTLIFHKIWKAPLRHKSSHHHTSSKTGNTANKLAENMLELEVDLLWAKKVDHTSSDTPPKEFTVPELQRKCGIFSWETYLKAITSKTIGKVVVHHPHDVFRTCDVIKKYNGYLSWHSTFDKKKTLQNYLLVSLVKNLMEYYDESILHDEKSYTHKHATTEKATKPAHCLSLTDKAFGLVTGNIYLKETKFECDKHRSKIETILHYVRDHYKTILKQSTWLDDKTRDTALSKLDNIYIKLLYPPIIKDSGKISNYYKKIKMNSHNWYNTVIEWMKFEFEKKKESFARPYDRSVWRLSPKDINAVHVSWFNDLTISAGIIQPPFFDDTRPMVMNFGAIGTVIGHEMTHSFGTKGRQFNQFGLIDDWVTLKCKDKLRVKYECFTHLYHSLNTRFHKLHSHKTLQENLADNGGINAAYGAYQTWKLKNNEHLSKDEEAWIKNEGTTLDKLFFVAFSQMYCGKGNHHWLKTLSSHKHSPGVLRVKGPFETNEFIRSAFSCNDSHSKQCTLW